MSNINITVFARHGHVELCGPRTQQIAIQSLTKTKCVPGTKGNYLKITSTVPEARKLDLCEVYAYGVKGEGNN